MHVQTLREEKKERWWTLDLRAVPFTCIICVPRYQAEFAVTELKLELALSLLATFGQ